MIITPDDLRKITKYEGLSDEECIAKIKAVESIIRSYTHNDFQFRRVRFIANVEGGVLQGTHPFLKIGDTIQITNGNDCFCYITALSFDTATVDADLYDFEQQIVTLIKYPEDVKNGAFNMLQWEANNKEKVGVQSESISRHSVTYFNMDSNNSVMGYPVSLLGFLEPYMKARF